MRRRRVLPQESEDAVRVFCPCCKKTLHIAPDRIIAEAERLRNTPRKGARALPEDAGNRLDPADVDAKRLREAAIERRKALAAASGKP